MRSSYAIALLLAAVLIAALALPGVCQTPPAARPTPADPGISISWLVMRPQVQQELKVSPALRTTLRAIVQEFRDKMSQVTRGTDSTGRGVEERARLLSELRAEQDKRLLEALDPAQRKRLKEIELQQTGPTALARDEIAAALGLTKKQREQIAQRIKEGRDKQAELARGVRSNPSDWQANRAKMDKIREETGKQILALLTEEETRKWKEMQGAPFKLTQPSENTPTLRGGDPDVRR